MPSFTPTDPKDFPSDFTLIPDGEYGFEIKKVEEKTGPKGPYFKLTLAIFVGDKERLVWDNLSFTENALKRLWGFCQSTGMEQEYHEGCLNSVEVQGKVGRLQLGHEDAKDQYEAKNIVKFYRRRKEAVAENPIPRSSTMSNPEDDDIPF